MQKQTARLSYIFVLVSVAAALLLLFRVPYGADVTDRSYSVAEPYLLVRGAVPFCDNWSQTTPTYLLTAPIIRLFITITGGTEGVMVYTFYVSFFFRLAVPILMWFLLRKRMEPFWAAVFCLLFFICDCGSQQTLNYDHISLALLALGGALLFNALGQEKPRDAAIRYALAGFVMALCALAHSTQIVNCFLFFVFLLVLEHRRWGKLPCWLPYALTGLITAALTIVGLEVVGGGGLFSGVFLVLKQYNYFRIPHKTLTAQLRSNLSICLTLFRIVSFPFAGILTLYLVAFRRRGRQAFLPGLMAALAGSCGFVCLFYARSFIRALYNGESTSLGVQSVFLFLFLTAPVWFFLLPQQGRRQFMPGFLFFWAADLSTIILSATATIAQATSRYYVLTSGALFSLPLAAAAFKARTSEERLSSGINKALLLFIAGAFAVYTLSVQYAVVYRDDPISALTCQVERGVYKGLYTTPERAEALQELEDQLQARVSPGEAVLFADLMPMAYLMTDGLPCTPSTWDPCYYRYGFQDDDLYQSYFEKTGRVPDKIFFIQSEERPLSIDDPENEFAAWVHTHYTLAETVGEGRFSFRLFIRNP